MSFLDKVKNMVNVSEDDYYDELESDDFQTAEPAREEAYEEPRRAPRYNVDVMGDLLDELENNGVFF